VKSDVETLSPTRVRLSVEVTFDELKPSVDSAYKKIAQQITVPGFRKGKVPQRVIDQRIGRGAVLDEAVNEALPRAYGEALTENDIKVLGQPDVEVTDFADGADLKFTAEVDIRPEIALPDFATLQASVDDVVVADADITEQIESLQSRFATVKPVERPAADGDMVTLDLAGELDGEPVESLSATGMSYQVGSGNLLENLDETVAGLSEAESGTFSFTPESGELADQEVTMTVTVTSVKERELPGLDDDFAQTVSEFDTLDELRDALRSELEPSKQVEQLMAARDAVLAELLKAVEVPVPEGVVASAIADHFGDGHGDDDHKSEYESTIRESITRDLVLDTIADQESVAVSQAELTEYLVRQAPQYGMTPEQFIQALTQSGQVTAVFGEVRRAKALSVVLAAASVTDASGRVVDLSSEDLDVEAAEREIAAEEAESERLEELEADALEAEEAAEPAAEAQPKS
jgi:trigger factor